jgi:hypothetical protein
MHYCQPSFIENISIPEGGKMLFALRPWGEGSLEPSLVRRPPTFTAAGHSPPLSRSRDDHIFACIVLVIMTPTLS